PNTVTTTDPVTGVTTTTTLPPTRQQQNNQAMQIASQTVGQSMNNIAQMALRNSINIPPTIYLDQGAAVTVFV
ncbi:TrbI/VirB10 family protein, partial [Pseudomonas aeruginosa]